MVVIPASCNILVPAQVLTLALVSDMYAILVSI